MWKTSYQGYHSGFTKRCITSTRRHSIGFLCVLTAGEAKNVIKSVSDVSGDFNLSGDGYNVFAMSNQRFDAKTSTSLLQSFWDVVNLRP